MNGDRHMRIRRFGSTLLALALTTNAVSPALAGDGLVGGLVGGIVAGAIITEAQRNRRNRGGGVTAAQVEVNRKIQTALNYFGFPCGTPDGVLGKNSRAAISQYQVTMGYAGSGQLTEYEQSFLLASYDRAIAGGMATTQLIASMPQGPRGLLLAYRDEAAAAALPGTGAATTTTTVVINPATPANPETQAPDTVAAAAPALPNFMGTGGGAPSLASHCNKVSLLTNSNGGFVTLASMSDPTTVLNEQFCLARTYAITEGEDLAAGLSGVTPQDIAAQCKAFGPIMEAHVATLSLEAMPVVVKGVQGFILENGMSPAQMTGTAKICLSVGYRTDDMEVAVGSALLLYALGEKPYGELLGHHLTHGFGATERSDLAKPWYLAALDALETGTPAVFAPGQPERAALIRAAVSGGRSGAAEQVPAAEPVAAKPLPGGLPNFNVKR